jgi:dihydrofolate reductase
MAAPRITVVAAVARNGVIGKDNRLVWHLPEDMKHFRRLTMGAPVIMGRKTWDSLPERFRPLPGRRNIVLSRQPGWQAAGAEVAPSLAAALAAAADAPQVFVIGGGQAYAEAMAIADQLVITEIDHDFVGDTYFPPRPATFAETTRETHRAAAPNTFEFSFVTYQRTR